MINILGKSLAFLHVALSVAMMAVAVALYANAVDFGWEQPTRLWRDVKGKKDENLLVPSFFDKREAALRKLVRVEHDQLIRLGTAQDSFSKIEIILGQNHLEGEEILANLYDGTGEFKVYDCTLDDKGELVLKPGRHSRLGFPALTTEVKGVKMSYLVYLDKLKDVDGRIVKVYEDTEVLQKKLKKLGEQLNGDEAGGVREPGWYYLIEAEVLAQKELLKEIEYLKPLWAEERDNARLVVGRREQLLRRLQELGETPMTQSEWMLQNLKKR